MPRGGHRFRGWIADHREHLDRVHASDIYRAVPRVGASICREQQPQIDLVLECLACSAGAGIDKVWCRLPLAALLFPFLNPKFGGPAVLQ